MKLFFRIFFLLFFITSFASAQSDKAFEASNFQKELMNLLNNTKQPDCEAASKSFENSWLKLNGSQQNSMIEIANLMRTRKMLVLPYFRDFVVAVNAYAGGKISSNTFDEWSSTLKQLISNLPKGNNKAFQEYIDFSKSIFTENALNIAPGRTWKITATEFTLDYIDNVPVAIISSTDLLGITNGDTLIIHNTSGKFFPIDKMWLGTKGMVDWSRAGLDATQVHARFDGFKIDLDKNEYSVDSAYMTYEPFLKQELKGQFQDKLLANNTPENSSYPRFISYNHDILIDNIADNAALRGAISIQGSKLSCSGGKDFRAILELKRYDNAIGVRAFSNTFVIKKFEDIYAPQAEVKIYIGKDSIYHTGATLKYRVSTKQLILERGKDGIARSPFFDSFHQNEIYVDAIYWRLDELIVKFSEISGSAAGESNFESVNYFEKGRLDKYQNVSDYNIINMIKKYTEKNQTKEIYTDELAKFISPTYNAETIRRTLYKLVEDGFIYYDESKELVTVRQKTINYVLADQKRMDYDNIKMTSTPKGSTNAQLDLSTYSMNVKGIKSVLISDSNFVVIFPRSDSLIEKKNRDIDFDGKIFAGRIDMYGSGFGLLYDDWKMKLTNVDSMLINLPNGQYDKTGALVLVPIHSFIERLTGELQIDSKFNKSGKVRTWSMPALKSTDNSYVFYERPSAQKSVYDKNKFFYQLDPFEFDSLNSFLASRVEFKGKLISAGIFPDIIQPIGIQKDLSLGFVTKRTALPMYGGKGNYTNTISLDNRGLLGKGTINYLPSVTQSENIIFFPDSTKAVANLFDMKATTYGGVDYPTVEGHDVNVLWKPYADSMMVKVDSIPFKMFGKETDMRGTLVLTPNGLKGSGTVDWVDATLKSGDISFGKNKMSADTSDFVIKSIDPKKFALSTKNVNSNIDFDKQVGDFKSNTDDIATELPYNQYRTSMNEFKWDMAKKNLKFIAPEGTEALFTSMHPNQDSLSFTGSTANYSLTDFILKVSDVPFISVVDAKIYPDSGKVIVEPDAVMRTLYKAKLSTDTINEFHNFFNVTANVFGKQSFKGSGDYNFVGKKGTKQKINFTDIGVYKDSTKHLRTYAKTVIDTSQKFQLIPKIYYSGLVNIKSTEEQLNFEGYAKLQLSNPNVRAEWFSINNNFTSDSSLIYYKDPEDLNHKPATVGIVFGADSSDLYTSFFQAKKTSKDRNLFLANGIVYYDETTKEFIAGNAEKILNEATRGNMIKYNDATAKVYAEGKMDMGLNFGLVDVQAGGYINTDLIKNEYKFTLLAGIQFDIKDNLLEMMGKTVLANNFSQEDVDYFSDDFTKNIPEFINPKNDKKFSEAMNKDGTFKKPEDFKYTIFFTDLHLVWDKETRSFYSKGPIGIAYIGPTAINRMVQGAYLEIGYKKSGDYMNLYIPGDDDKYYYFFYQNNNLQILSGDRTWMTELNAIDPEKRRTKTDDGKIYQYTVASENKKNTFIARMQFIETGKKEFNPNKQ